jgi:hypothetical protein
LEQRLQLRIARAGNQCVAQGGVDRSVEGDLVLDIGAVERAAAEVRKPLARRLGLAGQRGAGRVLLRRHVQPLDQVERLAVHRLVIAHHRLGEGAHLRVVGYPQRLAGVRDVDLAGRVGDMGDLRVGRGLRRCRRGERDRGGRGERCKVFIASLLSCRCGAIGSIAYGLDAGARRAFPFARKRA